MLCQRPPSELRDGIALGAQSLLNVSDGGAAAGFRKLKCPLYDSDGMIHNNKLSMAYHNERCRDGYTGCRSSMSATTAL